MGERSGGESEGKEVRSVVLLEEVEFRFCTWVRNVLALWLLVDPDEARDEERRCGCGSDSAMTQRVVTGMHVGMGCCGLHECLQKVQK